eukprot:Sspe_Gene.57588::Locus_31588_Transcript_1_1_Confidence_1.000_Length_1537::g.57588::m.57588
MLALRALWVLLREDTAEEDDDIVGRSTCAPFSKAVVSRRFPTVEDRARRLCSLHNLPYHPIPPDSTFLNAIGEVHDTAEPFFDIDPPNTPSPPAHQYSSFLTSCCNVHPVVQVETAGALFVGVPLVAHIPHMLGAGGSFEEGVVVSKAKGPIQAGHSSCIPVGGAFSFLQMLGELFELCAE